MTTDKVERKQAAKAAADAVVEMIASSFMGFVDTDNARVKLADALLRLTATPPVAPPNDDKGGTADGE